LPIVAGVAAVLDLRRLQHGLVVAAAIQPVAAGARVGRDRGLLTGEIAHQDPRVHAGRRTDQAAQLIDVPDHVAGPGVADIEAESADLAVIGLRDAVLGQVDAAQVLGRTEDVAAAAADVAGERADIDL
jgi:hypothetical protein